MRAVSRFVDEDSFERVDDGLSTTDPLDFPGYRESVERARASSDADESVVTGAATIGGHRVEVAAFDFSFLGGSAGEVAGERIARAMERASQRAVPFVLRAATGGARMQEGLRALAQLPKVVSARVEFGASGLPFIAVLGAPSTGGVLASVGSLADVTIAEAGATVGFAGPRLVERFTGRKLAGSHTAETALAAGLVDAVVPSDQVAHTVAHVLDVIAPDEPDVVDPVPPVARSTESEKDPWDVVERARRDDRPLAPDLLRDMLDGHAVLQGDRGGREDPAVVAALGRIGGRRVLVLAMDRRIHPGPAAFRKARRSIAIAARLRIPVVTLIDTPGANPSEASENSGIAWEIAKLFEVVLTTPVPVVAVVTGQGGSGGALAFATGDRLLAYEASVFSIIAPDAAADILWRDSGRAPEAARLLKLTAANLVDLKVADALVREPLEASSLRQTLAYHLEVLGKTSQPGAHLAAARRLRWRTRGK